MFERLIKKLGSAFVSKEADGQEHKILVEHKGPIADYDKLNFFLSQSQVTVKIDVCGTNTNNEYAYSLEGYLLDYLNHFLLLKLSLKDNEQYHFEPNFKNIKSISFVEKENAVKIWIESDSSIGRFFIFDIHLDGEVQKTNTSSYWRQPKDYEKYEKSDPFMYHICLIKEDNPVLLEKYFDAKNGEKYGLLLSLSDAQGIIWLVSKHISKPCLYFYIENGNIKIDDIIHTEYNVGIGTEAVNWLIQYGKSKSYETIYGDLSKVDNDHKDRRDYFYQKLGFTVSKKQIKMDL